jgi:hypothetical protein
MVLTTKVHTNTAGSLTILPCFLQSKFGTWKTPQIGGACLLMQLSSIYRVMHRVSHQRIQQAIFDHVRRGDAWGERGANLQDTYAVLSKLSAWKLSGCIVHDVDSAPEAIANGSPIVIAMDSCLIDTYPLSDHGVARLNRYGDDVSLDRGYNHALLIFGYDRQARHFIARESRSRYTNRSGMLKIDRADLLKWKDGWRMVELVFTKGQQA